MVYRKMCEADRAQAVALWRQVFGDEDAFIQSSINMFTGANGVCVAKDGETVCAILSAAPCTAEGSQGIYLYALATRAQSRGQGVMAALMRYAEQEAAGAGCAFSVLIPADEGLYAYYHKCGYGHTLFLRHLELLRQGNGGAQARVLPPGAALLQDLRARWLPGPAVCFGGSARQAVAADLRDSGALVAVRPGGYAVFYPPQGGRPPLLAELAAESDAEARAVADAALGHMAASRAQATLPAAGLFAGQGRPRPAAVLKTLQGGYQPPQGLYLRFAMDAPQ